MVVQTAPLSVKEAGEVRKQAGSGLTADEKKKPQAQAKGLQENAKKLAGEAREKKDDKAAKKDDGRKAEYQAKFCVSL